MGSLHSLISNLVTAGTLYGWRIDAILVGGLLWMLMAAIAHGEASRWPVRRLVAVSA